MRTLLLGILAAIAPGCGDHNVTQNFTSEEGATVSAAEANAG